MTTAVVPPSIEVASETLLAQELRLARRRVALRGGRCSDEQLATLLTELRTDVERGVKNSASLLFSAAVCHELLGSPMAARSVREEARSHADYTTGVALEAAGFRLGVLQMHITVGGRTELTTIRDQPVLSEPERLALAMIR